MLIKVSDELRAAAFRIPAAVPVPDGDLAPQATVSMVPNWLLSLLEDSSIIVIDEDDWLSIPYEVSQHIKVLHR
jgi:hypothetical protein